MKPKQFVPYTKQEKKEGDKPVTLPAGSGKPQIKAPNVPLKDSMARRLQK